MDIRNILLSHANDNNREFISKLVPNISKDTILGIKIPVLRNLGKELSKRDDIEIFLNDLPHKYLEENLLHVVILPLKYKNFNTLLEKLDIFLPYMNNWMVTDTLKTKQYEKYPDIGYEYIKKWLNSNSVYTIRYAIVVLLSYYLKDNYKQEILDLVSKIDNQDYYVKMAISWFYSCALIHQYEDTIIYFKEYKLDSWIHNKSIQKAIESYRIDDSTKQYLRTLKIK